MRALLSVSIVLCLCACSAAPDLRWPNGTLLLIGGGLDDDARAVYERFVELAGANGAPRIVVLTAATGPQDQEAIDKTEALRTWAPTVPVEVVLREASTADTVAAIDRASGLFFTGGDQKRITARYRPEDRPTPEWLAMVRLLTRGGVIAGASAGCAMMGQQMLLGGPNAAALRIADKAPTPGEPPAQLGPRLGPGMRFLNGALTDSHFFERDRIGRVTASMLAGPDRLAIGVGEDAAVEVDLARGELLGLTASESLLVDGSHARSVGKRIVGLRARLLPQGERLPMRAFGSAAQAPMPAAAAVRNVPVAEPGQNRQLASWRLFRQATNSEGVVRLAFDGWRVFVWRDGDGLAFELEILD